MFKSTAKIWINLEHYKVNTSLVVTVSIGVRTVKKHFHLCWELSLWMVAKNGPKVAKNGTSTVYRVLGLQSRYFYSFLCVFVFFIISPVWKLPYAQAHLLLSFSPFIPFLPIGDSPFRMWLQLFSLMLDCFCTKATRKLCKTCVDTVGHFTMCGTYIRDITEIWKKHSYHRCRKHFFFTIVIPKIY